MIITTQYKSERIIMRICSIDGCGMEHYAKSFCSMHYARLRRHGDANTMLIALKGEGTINAYGYRVIQSNGISIAEHILIAEKAIGHKLPKGAHVHHVNGDALDNRNENLVICPDHAYHSLLHIRTNAINAGKPAHYRKCKYCKEYDDIELMAPNDKNKSTFFHRDCRNKHRMNLKNLTKEK